MNIIGEYFSKEDAISVNEFARRYVSIKDKGSEYSKAQTENHIEVAERQIRKWKNGYNSPRKDSLEIIKKVILQIEPKEKGRFAWDIDIRDLYESPYKYKDNITSKPPFLTDDEFKELNSLYPPKDVYEEILTKEADFSNSAAAYIEKLNRFLKGAKKPTDTQTLLKDMYIWYDHYKTGRLYGSNILEAPREIFEYFINLWFGYYRGSELCAYHDDYLDQLGLSVAMLSMKPEPDYFTNKDYIYIGNVDLCPNEPNKIYHLYDIVPLYMGARPILYKVLGMDNGKLGEIISKCHNEKDILTENTGNTYKVKVIPNYLARKYYEWFLANGYDTLDCELMNNEHREGNSIIDKPEEEE